MVKRVRRFARRKIHLMHGFSLVELLVVMTIIAVLSAIGFVIYREVRYQAIASKMIVELETISTVWKTWALSDVSRVLPQDTNYPLYQGTPECGTWYQNPPISITDVVTSGYLQNAPLNPITNREYRYDNDLDPDSSSYINGGVNLRLYFCNQGETNTALEIVTRMDDKIDNGDGASTGKISWRPADNEGTLTLVYKLALDSRRFLSE